jgi:hypothetical protein
MVGLSPVTLTNYTRSGYSDLMRRQDYLVLSFQIGPTIEALCMVIKNQQDNVQTAHC